MAKNLFRLLFLFVLTVPVFAQKQETTTLKVYFGNQKLGKNENSCGEVFAVTRTVPKTARVARAALEQLFAGPTAEEKKEGYSSFFSDKTKSMLISVKVKNNAAYVNLRRLEAFLTSGANSSCGSAELLSEMDETLKQFPAIKKVFYAFEGDPDDFYGWMQFICPEELKNCSGKYFK